MINQLNQTNGTDKRNTINHATTDIQYKKMDARELEFQDDTFTCIIDKGTCDAMLCDNKKAVHNNQTNNTNRKTKNNKTTDLDQKNVNIIKGYENVKKIFHEMIRVLRIDTICHIIYITHLEADSKEFQEFSEYCILPILYTQQHMVKWTIDAHVFEDEENDNKSATVLIIKSIPRKQTRLYSLLNNNIKNDNNSNTNPSLEAIIMKLHCYSS